MKKILLASALLLSLSACAADTKPQAHADYVLPPKITLDVQAINLVDRNPIQPPSSPYSSNHFQPTIEDAIRQWAKDRLQAVGTSGQAVVIIKDASLTQQSLPHETDLFTRQQGNKYIAHAEVELEARGHEGYALASAQASRFETLPDNATEGERQTAYFNVLNGLMKDLGQNLETSIRTHMHDFVVTAPIFGMTAPIPGSAPVNTPAPVGNTLPPYYSAQPATFSGQPIAPVSQASGYPGQPMAATSPDYPGAAQ